MILRCEDPSFRWAASIKSIYSTKPKKHNIQQVIIDAGYMVEYLPTYSPDLNPIEHKWAQAKSKKRESACDTEILFSVHIV
ncbi:transposase [Symbiopectobacterium sp. RP]|uniref:transposase n=1 Tax=Symbiopectobacterium sp. RP TaxID=3248553 RepID=UPI003D2DF139